MLPRAVGTLARAIPTLTHARDVPDVVLQVLVVDSVFLHQRVDAGEAFVRIVLLRRHLESVPPCSRGIGPSSEQLTRSRGGARARRRSLRLK